MRKLEWNAYYYNINQRKIEKFNIFYHSSFRQDIEKILKKNKERTKDAEEEILRSLMYYYWSKAEWEILLCPWIGENNNEMKLDVYDQVMMNWNHFLDYIFEK